MKTLLMLVAIAALLPVTASAERAQGPQQVMALDLGACAHPAYPPAALAQRSGGKTTVEIQIDTEGIVSDARVLVSSGRADLDEAALANVRRCTFHAVVATGQTPTGWLKTQFVWIPSDAKTGEALDQATFARTKTRADAGDPVAQNQLGNWYERGTYVKADVAQAAAWYLLAAKSGNAIAQNNLGVLYSRGHGVPHDPKQAVYWYALAAEQGHHWAQANLAWAYQYGSAGELDIDKALAWLTKAADGGLTTAQVRLGLLTMKRAESDDEKAAAAAWFARAAAQGDPAGAYYLGRTFELGLGNTQDDAQAAALYPKALERSGGRAEIALGVLVETGRAGAADQDRAVKLYQKAMQWHHPAAYYHYGLILEQRGERDLATAVFRQGAELGNCDAIIHYVQMRQAAGVTPAAGTPDANLAQRAQWCSARPVLSAVL